MSERADNGRIMATPLARRLIAGRKLRIDRISPSGSRGEIKARDVLNLSSVKYTPMAKKLADSRGVDIASVPAAGARVRKADVLGYNIGGAHAAQAMRTLPLTAVKRVTGQRMLKAHSEIPPVTMNAKADVTGLLKRRAARNAKGGVKLSINDYVIHACAAALRDTPYANTSFSPDGIVCKDDINIGVAVALENGLVVPVIKNADRLSIEQLSDTMKELARRARAGTLSVDDYTGGTFTITNLGMYGITSFTPIINLPESLILGVCAIEQVVVLDENGLRSKDMMGLSLTFDHRVHDGAQAAVFLKKIIDNLEAGE